jgi:hypothetical protein
MALPRGDRSAHPASTGLNSRSTSVNERTRPDRPIGTRQSVGRGSHACSLKGRDSHWGCDDFAACPDTPARVGDRLISGRRFNPAHAAASRLLRHALPRGTHQARHLAGTARPNRGHLGRLRLADRAWSCQSDAGSRGADLGCPRSRARSRPEASGHDPWPPAGLRPCSLLGLCPTAPRCGGSRLRAGGPDRPTVGPAAGST